MHRVLKFGANSTLNLDLPRETLDAFCEAPRGEPLADVGRAVDTVLAEPIHFPPLVQAALQGDKVVLALGPDVPQAGTIIGRTIATLMAAGVNGADITVLVSSADGDPASTALQNDIRSYMPTEVRDRVTIEVHDPTKREMLCYLAASHDAQPIYIHRSIHSADLVISLGCIRHVGSPGYYGAGSSLFPVFSDTATIEAYRSAKIHQANERERLQRQVDEVSWLLGMPFTIQVIPGAGGQVLHVLAGDVEAVFREGQLLCEEAWGYWIPQRVGLAIVTVCGDDQQTWENVGRALEAASHAVIEEGDVALCTSLADRPGPAFQQLLGSDDPQRALIEMGRHRPADYLAATEWVQAITRGKLYVISQLDDELIEDLGAQPLVGSQLTRLAQRYDSCVVLSNAQHALARPRIERALESSALQPKSRR